MGALGLLLTSLLGAASGTPAHAADCPAKPPRTETQAVQIARPHLARHLAAQNAALSSFKLHEARYDCFEGRPIWFVLYRHDPFCIDCEILVVVGDRDSKVELAPGG
jgi:hypothetical protein